MLTVFVRFTRIRIWRRFTASDSQDFHVSSLAVGDDLLIMSDEHRAASTRSGDQKAVCGVRMNLTRQVDAVDNGCRPAQAHKLDLRSADSQSKPIVHGQRKHDSLSRLEQCD